MEFNFDNCVAADKRHFPDKIVRPVVDVEVKLPPVKRPLMRPTRFALEVTERVQKETTFGNPSFTYTIIVRNYYGREVFNARQHNEISERFKTKLKSEYGISIQNPRWEELQCSED